MRVHLISILPYFNLHKKKKNYEKKLSRDSFLVDSTLNCIEIGEAQKALKYFPSKDDINNKNTSPQDCFVKNNSQLNPLKI